MNVRATGKWIYTTYILTSASRRTSSYLSSVGCHVAIKVFDEERANHFIQDEEQKKSATPMQSEMRILCKIEIMGIIKITSRMHWKASIQTTHIGQIQVKIAVIKGWQLIYLGLIHAFVLFHSPGLGLDVIGNIETTEELKSARKSVKSLTYIKIKQTRGKRGNGLTNPWISFWCCLQSNQDALSQVCLDKTHAGSTPSSSCNSPPYSKQCNVGYWALPKVSSHRPASGSWLPWDTAARSEGRSVGNERDGCVLCRLWLLHSFKSCSKPRVNHISGHDFN